MFTPIKIQSNSYNNDKLSTYFQFSKNYNKIINTTKKITKSSKIEKDIKKGDTDLKNNIIKW